jgi:predicted small secreted protein
MTIRVTAPGFFPILDQSRQGKTMKSIISSLVLVSVCLMATACNTWSGFGQDLQKVGSKVQSQGDKVKH